MNEQAISNDWRGRLGLVGMYGSATALASGVIVFFLMLGSFKTTFIGRLFASRAIILVDAFLLVLITSVLTLILSSFGRGKQRTFGVAMSILTIVMVIFIFGANE